MRNPDRHPRPRASEQPSDELILAAVERAARHRARDTPEVPVWEIFDHLAVAARSAAARHVRSRLAVLQEAGSLAASRRHGVPIWALTATGGRRLQAARLGGEAPRLPESPQHRSWRNARTAAAQEIDRFRRDLGDALEQAASLLGEDPPVHSDAWFELGERLQRAAWNLASAGHCLYEWAEPDDMRADVDDLLEPSDDGLAPAERTRRRARRAGRRNVRLWRSDC